MLKDSQEDCSIKLKTKRRLKMTMKMPWKMRVKKTEMQFKRNSPTNKDLLLDQDQKE